MKGKAKFFQKLTSMTLAQPLVADAHSFHWASESIGFLGGLIHPTTSMEHVLTMLLVGLCLSQMGNRSAYVMPFLFVVLMLMGGGLTLIPIEIADAENLMWLSVLLLGLMLVFVRRVSQYVGALIIASVAVLHGYVHAYDIWLDVDAVGYSIGFALMTMVLILVGIGSGWMVKRLAVKFSPVSLVER